MKNIFYKTAVCVFALLLIAGSAGTVYAAETYVTYDGTGNQLVFEPGGGDLFLDTKGMMPGDRASETIVVRNKGSKTVNIYFGQSALFEGYKKFLNYVTVTLTDEGGRVLFSGSPSAAEPKSDQVLIGEFKADQTMKLHADIALSTDTPNEFMNYQAVIPWRFTVSELTIPPVTQDGSNILFWGILSAGAMISGFGLYKARLRQRNRL